ncbi:hypothetical protein JKP88DRAFT_336137 [Tribonema minus]|uniref:Uncharacterized protein n=1 Tax=Tribonema minus TaxID=303371 RepID=A0A835YKA5_9STRA|nr:hypothetical protein JKP88DRAFT_336137 [Tribonema minus]
MLQVFCCVLLSQAILWWLYLLLTSKITSLGSDTSSGPRLCWWHQHIQTVMDPAAQHIAQYGRFRMLRTCRAFSEQQFAHWHFGARRDLSACFAHLRTLRTVPRVWRVINNPLEKKQVSSHSGANAAINGALHVTIPAPLELHRPMIVILFILRRLRAVIFKNDPAHVLMGLPGNKSVQVHIDNYTDFINELRRLQLALNRYGIYSFRNATATAICTAAKMQEEQGHHQLAATTLARGAQQQLWHMQQQYFDQMQRADAARTEALVTALQQQYVVQMQQWQAWQQAQQQRQIQNAQYMFERMQNTEHVRMQAMMTFQDNLVNRLLGPPAMHRQVSIEGGVNVGSRRTAPPILAPQAKRGRITAATQQQGSGGTGR